MASVYNVKDVMVMIYKLSTHVCSAVYFMYFDVSLVVRITFTPTIQHCSMATVIGLCLRLKLKDFVPSHYKVDIKVAPGSHADEEADYLLLSIIVIHSFDAELLQVDIKVAPGSHADEEAVNKQLNDKERVAAAMENPNLRQLVDECLHSREL
ncbi:hypothetical protein CTI12_AA423980 [Artemisia annua]|uniref:MIP18 family-like domain-containing protein n=1 Tax=Artemisia annua TaxID=35608 RepID=A0A2U1M3Q5_ARTAN|nr:hypothetical protein CTI12_AA423980 [Artemisia annua]